MLIKQNRRPKNESEIHYELKQIAKYILKSKGYNSIGEEINVNISKYLKDFKQFNIRALNKCIIDVLGIYNKGSYIFYKDIIFKQPVFKSIGIESKASLEDFKNGFCCTTEKTYVIAPIGVIPINLIPDKIGLIEVDLENYSINKFTRKDTFKLEGVFETVKPKIRIDDIFVNKNKPSENQNYQNWCKGLVLDISHSQTNADIFKNNQVIINCKNWSGNLK